MKGQTKFWIAVFAIIVIKGLAFVGGYYYENWSVDEELRYNTLFWGCVILAVWSYTTLIPLLGTLLTDETITNFKPWYLLCPIYYPIAIIGYPIILINKLANKYL